MLRSTEATASLAFWVACACKLLGWHVKDRVKGCLVPPAADCTLLPCSIAARPALEYEVCVWWLSWTRRVGYDRRWPVCLSELSEPRAQHAGIVSLLLRLCDYKSYVTWYYYFFLFKTGRMAWLGEMKKGLTLLKCRGSLAYFPRVHMQKKGNKKSHFHPKGFIQVQFQAAKNYCFCIWLCNCDETNSKEWM